MSSKREKALSYFSNKCHCAQAVIAAYAPELGLTEEQALKVSACFGSGMRKGEVCGACSGALMVLGMMYARNDPNDPESRPRANELNELFLNEFSRINDSYVCRDLLHCDISTKEGIAYAMEHRLFTEFCPRMVASAVDVLEEIINCRSEEEKQN